MKVLHVATLTTDNSIPQLSRLSSGYGLMVKDIAYSVSNEPDINVKVFLLKRPFLKTKNQLYRHLKVYDVFKSFFCGNYAKLFSLICRHGKSLKNIRDILYYFFVTYSLKSIIQDGKFDLIHIHGCGFWNTYIIDLCERLNQKCLFTLHGLNSFGGIDLNLQERLYEREFLKILQEKKFNLTIISTGCKRTIEQYFKGEGLVLQQIIKVICNGANIASENESKEIDIRKKYDIPKDKKIVLYIGNINERKNQIGFIDGFKLFLESYNIDTYVMFIGRNDLGEGFIDKIRASNISDRLIVCGNVPKDHIIYYLKQSDGVALISKSEGFGLSLVEGMMAGKPCMMVEDMAAFDDIYDPKCCVRIATRNNEDVAEGVFKLLSTKWDKDFIRCYSEKFSLQTMAQKYIGIYKETISK